MSEMPYHKRYHSDALAGFMSLTLEERGAYQTVLDMIYDRGGPIADNDRLLAGYMQCSIRKWRSIRESLLAKGKIYLTGEGLISNDRAEDELEKSAKTSRKRAESGSKGGRARVKNEKKANENNEGDQARLEHDLSDIRSQKPDTLTNVSGGSPPIDLVKVMFDEGVALLVGSGTRAAQARSLIGRWRKDMGDEWALGAIRAAQAASATNPVEWIEGRKRRAPPAKPTAGTATAGAAAARYAARDAARDAKRQMPTNGVQ